MSESVYRKLALRLDEIPNGFPATESGAELKLLAKIFTPEEATLAAELRLKKEPVAEIAARVGVDPAAVTPTLKAMVRKGQITVGRKDRQLSFGLMPFAVGVWEEQLPRIDKELAELFETYLREAQGIVGDYAPALHRVLPVREAIPAGIEVFPYEQAELMLENAKAWGVRDCICRVQQQLVGKGCDRPVENCLTFAPVEGVFDNQEATRPITKEAALRILREAEDAGLVHSPGNYQDGNFYICNCCTCCCSVLRSVAEFGIPTAIASSDFVSAVDADLCAGCGDCLDRCQFGALALPEDICLVDAGRCVGCGLCVTVCSTEALYLERRPEGEIPPPPADFPEWMAERAKVRGVATP